MATEAPSWADQWGAGGIGAIEEEKVEVKKEDDNKKKGSTPFAKKLKNGTSNGIKWLKNKCQKKNSNLDSK
ncbi:hypothetical protein Hanom_Chr16g01451391 [Helianthus anomalus]